MSASMPAIANLPANLGYTPAALTDNAVTILKKRYLSGGESIDEMFQRVAGGNKDYLRLMRELKFLPNSPTLFNLGLNNGCTASACFTLNVRDSMFGKGSITDVRNKAIAIAKAGGGVGYSFSQLRPKGSPITSIHRVACGPVTVLRDYQGISRMITQGGKRELAQMGVLACDHPDIREFIHCKDEDPQGMGSFNLSVAWKDSWLEQVDFDKCDDSSNEPTKLWWEQCTSAWKTGCPGVLFIDVINKYNINKHLGLIECTNPCGEYPGRGEGEPCNLGSLSLSKYFDRKKRKFRRDEFLNDVSIAMRFLDNVLDRNTFPHPDITECANLTRRLGLGLMGWADLLALMGIQYDTEEAVEFGRKLMKDIKEVTHRTSIQVGKEKGYYPGYSDKTNGLAMRNETTTSIAPCGTIAIIAGVWGGIEPFFALRCERTTNEGIKLQDGVQDETWDNLDGFIPKTAGEVPVIWHIRHQAAFQENTDLAISKTINLPNNATVRDISKAYEMMYKMGCKGGTVFRDGCRSEQVLVTKPSKTKSIYMTDKPVDPTTTSVDIPTPGHLSPTIREKMEEIRVAKAQQILHTSSRMKLPRERTSVTTKLKVGGTELFLTVGHYPDGRVGEILVNGSFGATMTGLLNSFCITFSVALQNGVPLEELVKHHINTRFEPNGVTDDPNVKICTSIPDLISRWLEYKYLTGTATPTKMDSGIFCPDCGSEAIYQAGCLMCPAAGCGWTRCG